MPSTTTTIRIDAHEVKYLVDLLEALDEPIREARGSWVRAARDRAKPVASRLDKSTAAAVALVATMDEGDVDRLLDREATTHRETLFKLLRVYLDGIACLLGHDVPVDASHSPATPRATE